jgi:hypothetical protein
MATTFQSRGTIMWLHISAHPAISCARPLITATSAGAATTSLGLPPPPASQRARRDCALLATLQTEEVDHCPLGHSGRWRPTPSTESGAGGPHCFQCPLNCPLAAHTVHCEWGRGPTLFPLPTEVCREGCSGCLEICMFGSRNLHIFKLSRTQVYVSLSSD